MRPDTRPTARRRLSYKHSLVRPPGVAGERMRSTSYFKAKALEILARPDLSKRDRARMLSMVRAMWAMFLQARRAGISLDDKIRLECEPRLWPSEARREGREAGEGRYHGSPCSRCGNTIRFVCDDRCATCKPGYFDR
jgi:hypothetical protein